MVVVRFRDVCWSKEVNWERVKMVVEYLGNGLFGDGFMKESGNKI